MKNTKNLFIIGLVLIFNGIVFFTLALSAKLTAFGALGCSFLTLGALALFLFHTQRKKMAPLQKIAAKRVGKNRVHRNNRG